MKYLQDYIQEAQTALKDYPITEQEIWWVFRGHDRRVREDRYDTAKT